MVYARVVVWSSPAAPPPPAPYTSTHSRYTPAGTVQEPPSVAPFELDVAYVVVANTLLNGIGNPIGAIWEAVMMVPVAATVVRPASLSVLVPMLNTPDEPNSDSALMELVAYPSVVVPTYRFPPWEEKNQCF